MISESGWKYIQPQQSSPAKKNIYLTRTDVHIFTQEKGFVLRVLNITQSWKQKSGQYITNVKNTVDTWLFPTLNLETVISLHILRKEIKVSF